MVREELKQMVRDLRDNTPCDEHSQRHCGCEKFDEIIDAIETLGSNDEVMTAQDFKNLAVISEYQDFHSDLDKSLKRAIRILRLCGYSVESPTTSRKL